LVLGRYIENNDTMGMGTRAVYTAIIYRFCRWTLSSAQENLTFRLYAELNARKPIPGFS